MEAQTISWLTLVKDFAGPVATLLAAGVATLIAFLFGRIQARVAKTQAAIALDKLKFDLFEKRYAVYMAAKQLIEYVIMQHDIDNVDSAKVRALYIKIDEARFFFDADVRSFLKQITDASESLLAAMGARQRLGNPPNDTEWKTFTEILSASTTALNTRYAELPGKFEESLAFRQVTNAASF